MRPEDRIASAVPVSNGAESVEIVTPTARQGELAVQHGSAGAQTFYHVSGRVSGMDASDFSLVTDNGGALETILLDQDSVLAQRTLSLAKEAHGPQGILPRLGMDEHLLVYGTPQANGKVLASVIYPDDGVVLDYDTWFNTASPPVDGPAVTATSGNTLTMSVGAPLPVAAAGIALSSLAVAPVGAVGLAGGVVIAAATVATGIVVSNSTRTAPPPPVTVLQTNTRGINIVLSHPARRALPAFAAAPAAPTGMAASWTPGASLSMQSVAGQPMLAAQLPLGGAWRLRGTASASGGVGLAGFQTDFGLDHRLTRFSSIGIDCEHQSFNAVDPLGNVGALTVDARQLRYTVRF